MEVSDKMSSYNFSCVLGLSWLLILFDHIEIRVLHVYQYWLCWWVKLTYFCYLNLDKQTYKVIRTVDTVFG